ncbi:hypothetical protein, partial [Thomasclavelia ramosa]|uniref:hypothetical protein n=1 Tax=Thomasclavelia ramosa TaxID=1547 RepID=UPI001D02CC3A
LKQLFSSVFPPYLFMISLIQMMQVTAKEIISYTVFNCFSQHHNTSLIQVLLSAAVRYPKNK